MTKAADTVAAPTAETPGFAPPSVQETLTRPGRPLEAPVRDRMESRLGHDFSRVRVHSDAGAAASARAVGAQAYTVGSDVVFGAGGYAPQTTGGASLLAHELAHTVQQRDARPAGQLAVGASSSPAEHQADRAAAGERISAGTAPTATLMRRSILDGIAGLFAGDTFPKADLDAYVKTLDTSGAIEDFNESDNKARAVVALWAKDRSQFALTPKIKALLILEMLSGFTGDDDEQAILVLLNTADFADLTYIFGGGGVTADALNSAIDGDENDQLRVFFTSWFDGSVADIIAGKGTLRPKRTLSTPYQTLSLPLLLEDRAREIEAAVALVAPADQRAKRRDLARIAGEDLAAEVAKQAPADSQKAIRDMTVERVTRNDLFQQAERDAAKEVDLETSDAANAATHKANAERINAENTHRFITQTILDVALSGIGAATAVATSKADLAKQVTTLTPTQQTEAQEAIKPTVVATPPGVAKPKFVPKLTGEALEYKDKLMARAPKVVDETWKALAKNRQAADHVKKNLHLLSELEIIANAAKIEVDLVFGDYKKAAAFTADKFDALGNLTSSGTIHDVWQSEQAKKLADPSYEQGSAEFWMFYLLQNDDEVKAISFRHNAQPSLKEDHTPLNPEGTDLAAAANAELAIPAEVTRLFEIGRAWDAFNAAGEVSVQTFRGKTERDDRIFLWDMFFTLIHEYLHSLSATRYHDLETKLGGEATDPGNTLIEGVDSYFTEIVWTHARPRASLKAVRDMVEPEYVKKGRPFDASLLPLMPHRRYANYDKAAKLVSIVGIKNLYAAYFLGNVEAIGQTLP
jgi:hypothetical protein